MSARKGALALPLPIRFAARELRAGLGGFYIFIACIALGVAAIAGVGSFAAALQEGLREDGQAILGGDIAVSLIHTAPGEEEMAYLSSLGEMSQIRTARAITRTQGGERQALVEIKAVDEAYPLYGALTFQNDSRGSEEVLAARVGRFGLAIEETLLVNLEAELGDTLRIGTQDFTIAALIENEPDRLSDGFNFGPRVLMSSEALDATGLIQPGALVRYVTRVRMTDTSDAALETALTRLREDFPDTGWRVNSRDNAAPRLSQNIARFSQFLTLVALTALIVGGVGVGNAVNAFLQGKTKTIATLKAIGAPNRTVALTYACQLAFLSAIAIIIGLVIGASLPPLAGGLVSETLGLDARFSVYPGNLLLAAIYGAAITIVFALWPLGRTGHVKPTALFREGLAGEERILPRWGWIIALILSVLALCALVLLFTAQTRIALIYLVSVAVGFALLRGVAYFIMWAAAKLPSPRNPKLRLALRNLHRPGAPTPSIILSLGLGLALLVTLALIDVSITRQLTQNLPERAPNFFFLDIPRQDEEGFRQIISGFSPQAEIETVPMLRGNITAINGVRSEDYDAPADFQWVLSGDRGITYRSQLPEGARLTQGEWWSADTSENLISFDDELGRGLGLELGDELTVSVLGREISARIANFRVQEWENLNITFVMEFSPATFAGAPHMMLATVSLPEATIAEEQALLRSVIDTIPTATAVPVREALEFANDIVRRLATAVRSASAITLLTSLLVLAGAFAAGYQARVRDAVILKTLGATRTDVMKSFVLEYAFLGLIAAVFGVAAGMAGAYAILTFVMDAPFSAAPLIASGLALIGLLLTLSVGLLTSYSALSQRPAQLLRNL